MEYALILLLLFSLVFVLTIRAQEQSESIDDIERLECINQNLRMHIRDLEKDIDKLCEQNKQLSDVLSARANTQS